MTERLPSPRRPNARQRDSTYQTGQRCSDKRDHLLGTSSNGTTYSPFWATKLELEPGQACPSGAIDPPWYAGPKAKKSPAAQARTCPTQADAICTLMDLSARSQAAHEWSSRPPALSVPELIRDSKEVLPISYNRLDRVPIAVRCVPDSDVCSAWATHGIDDHFCESRVNGLNLSNGLRLLIDDSLNLVRCGPFVAGHPVRPRTPQFLSE